MPASDGSVGQGAQNQRHDVAVVQAALGKARGPGRKPFWPGPIDGDYPRHRRALDQSIAVFQQAHRLRPSGKMNRLGSDVDRPQCGAAQAFIEWQAYRIPTHNHFEPLCGGKWAGPGRRRSMQSTSQPELEVTIWRGAAGSPGGFVRYRVPQRADQTVLDVVTWVQRHLEPALAYRFACRVGMCGSCAMTVNGRPRWTCRSHVAQVAPDGRLEIAPLSNLPVIRDLATDMTGFFEKWQKAGGRFVPTATRAEPPAKVAPENPARKTADAGIECINCGVCHSACDVVRARPDYLGPAALNRAWTLVNDERHGDVPGVLRAVAQDGGCHSCHSQGSCTAHCPVGLDPSAAIAGLKRRTLWNLWGREGRP